MCHRLLRLATVFVSLASHTVATNPVLEVLYLRHNLQPIDTTPVFDPVVGEYKATLDWKMKMFSVQAKPVAPAVIDNVHICRHNADCLKGDQRVAAMDLSRNILVPPGANILYMFDVLLHGVVRSYTIIVNRLEGSETTIRQIIPQGNTLYPSFRQHHSSYQCFVDVSVEIMRLEFHLLDAGQTIFATAEKPVPLQLNDNITMLKNTDPGSFRSTPTRRLREMPYGEFQYPNFYTEFIVPLASHRLLNFEVLSADGSHMGWYQLKVARHGCPSYSPLFDSQARTCVRFCNGGYFADFEAHLCKRCHGVCVDCLSSTRCVRCPPSDAIRDFVLDNVTGTCVVQVRRFWQQHPDYWFALVLTIACFLFFCFGVGVYRHYEGLAVSSRKSLAQAALGKKTPEQHMAVPAPEVRDPARARNFNGDLEPGYQLVSTYDYDAY